MRDTWPRVLGFALLCLAALAAPAYTGAVEADVHILLYHRVGDARYPTTNVSREAFLAQMHWLHEQGFSVVSTRAVEDFLIRGEALPPRAVAIHFDDGYRSVFDNAFPVLRELGYPFTVFLPTEAVDRGYEDFMTWEMAAAMAQAGGSFGAHGHRHQRLLAPGDAGALGGELTESRSRIEARGLPARWVAYPYGEYTPQVTRAAKEQGFALGFSQDPGAIGRESDPFQLPRFAVVGSLGDLDAFRERLTYLPLAIEGADPPPGWFANSAVREIRAKIPDQGRFEPTSVRVFLSEWGSLPSTFDARTGWVHAEGRGGLTRRLNRVLVSLRERATGRYALGAWLLLNPAARP